jgi:hypothetical protein
LTKRISGIQWSADDRAVLQGFLDEPAATPMGNSVLRWQVEPLCAVILDGPHHALR